MKQYTEAKKLITEFFERNRYLIPENFLMEKDHIINTGANILCVSWDERYPGGSFAHAVANNNLYKAIIHADDMNAQLLKFYCVALSNIPQPIFFNEN